MVDNKNIHKTLTLEASDILSNSGLFKLKETSQAFTG
jgi:hypothetical protein